MKIIIGMLLLGTADTTDLALDYKKCVETFAIGQIRSGEAAEVLVQAGETNCSGFLLPIETAVRLEIRSLPVTVDGYKKLPKVDVDKLVEEAVQSRIAIYQKLSHEAVLRNVVFVKARINEREN